MLDEEFRAQIADWAERMAASRRKYREREAIENRRRATRIQAIDNIRYAGMPAHVVRQYQESRRKGEAAENG